MKIKLFPLLLGLLFLLACQEKPKQANERLLIVCTTGMLGDAVKNIVGKQADVVTLMGPGVDPHLYKATQGDLKKLSDADVIVYNGLHLEGKMGDIFEKLKNRKTILVASGGVSKKELINSTDFQGAYDPHLWFDVELWSKVVSYLGKKLREESLLNLDSLSTNTNHYLKELNKLDKWVIQELTQIDSSKRVLITAHDAFGYFGKAYQIEVKGLQGISTMSEYGLRDVSQLVNFISERAIPAVFVESSVSDRSLKAVVEGCKAKGHEIKIGGTLYSDAMGEKGTVEGTYVGMVKYNVNTIVEALK